MVYYVVIALWFVAVIVAITRAWRTRIPRLQPLSAEAQNRFTSSWRLISSRFLDAPRDTVHEADALVLSVLMERGHPVREDRLPGAVLKARRWLARERSQGTEALRQAMLQYESLFTKMLGRRAPVPDEAPAGRREMA